MKFLKITPNRMDDFNKKYNNMNGTILFHHPQCMHCLMMMAQWNRMKEELKKRNVNTHIIEVNGEDMDLFNNPLKNKVDGFPTILNLNNGKCNGKFEKERNLENLLEFVMSNTVKRNRPKKSVSFKMDHIDEDEPELETIFDVKRGVNKIPFENLRDDVNMPIEENKPKRKPKRKGAKAKAKAKANEIVKAKSGAKKTGKRGRPKKNKSNKKK